MLSIDQSNTTCGGSMGIEVGHVFPKKTFVVEPHRVAEYVTALGVLPEKNWAPEIGQTVPPGFFMYVTSYGAEDVHDYLGFDFLHTVYGGTDAEFIESVRIGDVLTVAPVITGVTVKESKGKTLTFAEITCEYINEHGRIAIRERSNTIEKLG